MDIILRKGVAVDWKILGELVDQLWEDPNPLIFALINLAQACLGFGYYLITLSIEKRKKNKK